MECDVTKRPYNILYVRNSTTPITTSSSAINNFDLGNVQVFSYGVPTASTPLAEIWVEYDIVFEKQQLVAGPLGGGAFVYAFQNTNADINHPFGTATTTLTQYGNLYLPVVTGIPTPDPNLGSIALGSGTFGFVALPNWLTGVFSVTIYWVGTAATIQQPVLGFGGNTKQLAYFSNDTKVGPYFQAPQDGATSTTKMMIQYFINVPPATGNTANTFSVTNSSAGVVPTASIVTVVLSQLSLEPVGSTIAVGNPGYPLVTASPW